MMLSPKTSALLFLLFAPAAAFLILLLIVLSVFGCCFSVLCLCKLLSEETGFGGTYFWFVCLFSGLFDFVGVFFEPVSCTIVEVIGEERVDSWMICC